MESKRGSWWHIKGSSVVFSVSSPFNSLTIMTRLLLGAVLLGVTVQGNLSCFHSECFYCLIWFCSAAPLNLQILSHITVPVKKNHCVVFKTSTQRERTHQETRISTHNLICKALFHVVLTLNRTLKTVEHDLVQTISFLCLKHSKTAKHQQNF